MQILTAHTFEMDDPDKAAEDILRQIDLTALREHSLGIINCFPDFEYSGALKAVCDSLPFETVGCTTLGSATDGESNEDRILSMLSVFVLSSDEARFRTVLSDSLAKAPEKAVRDFWDGARQKCAEAPSLILAYLPVIPDVGGEIIVRLLTDATEGVPLFGTLACDHLPGFTAARTIHNGECHKDRMVLTLLDGPVSPKFFMISLTEEYFQKRHGIITKSEGNTVMEINNRPALEYMTDMGIHFDGDLQTAINFPFRVDYGDGTQPVCRGIYGFPCDGHIIYGGIMPQNSTIRVGRMDHDAVMLSADRILDRILQEEKPGGMLAVSCITRCLTLGAEPLAEADKVSERLEGKIPFQLCYSGGEICPVHDETGRTLNRYHNYTFVACLF